MDHAARGVALDGNLAVMGEVGLAGEIRAVPQAERRIVECARLGFTRIVLPRGNMRGIKPPEGAQLLGADTLAEALSIILKK